MSEQTTAPPVRTAPGVFRSPTSTKARALELLEALGHAPGQVADRLSTGGHLGVMQNCHVCPIADYLMHSDLGLWAVSVLGDVAVLRFSPEPGDADIVAVPAAVEQFIDQFDRGAYPHLMKPVTA